MSIFVGNSEIKNVYIGTTPVKEVYVGTTKVRPSIVNFATQGPCPDGFHVPLKSDWDNIVTTFSTLGILTTTNVIDYLKMPMAKYRNSSYSTINSASSFDYRSSSEYSNNDRNFAYEFYFSGSNVRANGYKTKSDALPIRPHKNVSATPNSSWTVLYQGTGASGIYHNSSLGLISISSNGTTRYTIADKNLGATTVYNRGDTLAEANCGRYYQRGNNYGFPGIGNSETFTTSSSQINASSYGPGNYYSSNIFRTRSSSPYAWDTTYNGNLRGGKDGNVPVS